MKDTHKSVQDYYGQKLKASTDLQTNACCTVDAPPKYIQAALANVHDEVQKNIMAVGLTIPNFLNGLNVLDLGSGSGRDCYIVSQLVGQSGSIVGVDMTKEQLAVANEYLNYHKEKFGYNKSNTSFVEGNIEGLDDLNFKAECFDLIISNCVINLAQNKSKVLQDSFNLLAPGGEMYFSDVYCSRRIPEDLQNDEVLWGECLSGALYWNDFENIAKNVGFVDPRVVEVKEITVNNKDLETKLEGYKFFSITYRLFKVHDLEQSHESYGHKVTYLGSIEEGPDSFLLDKYFSFNKDEQVEVDGNTFNILKSSRYKKHFKFNDCCTQHKGPFYFKNQTVDLLNEADQAIGCC